MKKRVLLAAAAALVVAILASCGGGQKKLFLFNWIYYIPDDVITDFTKETGIEVVVDSYASNEEMYNKIVAGGSGYDLIVPSGDYVSIMIAEKLLEPIDKTKLKNFGNLDPAAIARIGFDVGNTHSVPYMMGAAGVSVNKTKVSGYDHS
jgi:spermidine/putrescine transport system substrate-binding protein